MSANRINVIFRSANMVLCVLNLGLAAVNIAAYYFTGDIDQLSRAGTSMIVAIVNFVAWTLLYQFGSNK